MLAFYCLGWGFSVLVIMCFSRSVVDLLLCTLVQSYAPPWLWQALVVATMNVTMITPNDVSLRALSCRDVVNGSACDGCAEVQGARVGRGVLRAFVERAAGCTRTHSRARR